MAGESRSRRGTSVGMKGRTRPTWEALTALLLSGPIDYAVGFAPSAPFSPRRTAHSAMSRPQRSDAGSGDGPSVRGEVTPPRKYAIIGHNIAYSVSPAMQGAAFAAAGLPHTYGLIDEESVDTIVASDFWRDEAFGGLSVTIPHKQAIIPHMDELTEAARAIGAVNTVIVERGEGGKRLLRGDNTDWIGIYNPLKKRLAGGGDPNKRGVALILGAGGTARAAAYAASKLGLERVYHNRTPAKAVDLASSFGGTMVADLSGPTGAGDGSSLGDVLGAMGGEVRAVISTLPAASGFELPGWLVEGASGGAEPRPVVFDVNYKPYWTSLLRQAEKAGLEVVRGSEMLWEQGAGQFELWMGAGAPYGVMRDVVLENCRPEEGGGA